MSNAADLTAADLIALLREHPGACGMLGIETAGRSAGSYGNDVFLFPDDDDDALEVFRRWLVGAAVEKCDELGIEIAMDRFGGYIAFSGYEEERVEYGKKHPTRLHAALAALERHAKEKSNG